MREKFTILLIPFLLLLTACGSENSIPAATSSPTFTPIPPRVEGLCQRISVEPTPDAKDSSLFPPVNDADYSMGPKDAVMTIVEYGDFQ